MWGRVFNEIRRVNLTSYLKKKRRCVELYSKFKEFLKNSSPNAVSSISLKVIPYLPLPHEFKNKVSLPDSQPPIQIQRDIDGQIDKNKLSKKEKRKKFRKRKLWKKCCSWLKTIHRYPSTTEKKKEREKREKEREGVGICSVWTRLLISLGDITLKQFLERHHVHQIQSIAYWSKVHK